ncbi:MAG: tRNA pseudouridine(54/55) synthase Pus10 [Euryarchaeota archaeon]|nr:tRNA pseudouridine(54/55) synthase Pus10 [Euryarchaeota archaeon]
MAAFGDELRGAAMAIGSESLGQQPRLCVRCLGRLFAKVGKGVSNPERGAVVSDVLGYEPAKPDACPVCKGVFDSLIRFRDRVIREMEPWEHSSFLIGSRFDPAVVEAEEGVWAALRTDKHEPIKMEFNRELGKAVALATGKEANFEHPDVTVVLDTTYETVDLQIAAVFIRGNYRKLVRGIPQTRWPCKACMGKGCRRCGGTGKMYQTSVEEIIAAKLMPQANASAHFFHGMGREDIDARMLGDGRPFILELRDPHRRALDLQRAEMEVNGSGEGVEVTGLRPAASTEVAEIKNERTDKVYRVFVKFDAEVAEEKLNEVVSALRGSRIVQQTPTRVAHRRADMARHRIVRDMRVEGRDGKGAVLLVTAETGTYIKELVTGDGGRTTPNLSELLGVRCAVEALDVIAIGADKGCEQ